MTQRSATRQILSIVLLAFATTIRLPAEQLFQKPQVYRSGGVTATGVVVADLNQDGKPDVIVGNGTRALAVFLGNGDGTFESPTVYDPGIAATSLAVADLNGDGKLDVVVAVNSSCAPALCSPTLAAMLGRGDGTLGAPILYTVPGVGPSAIHVADVNRDGRPDVLAVMCVDAFCSQHTALGVLLGNGDGTFQPAKFYDSGDFAGTALTIADFNHDGAIDVALLHESGPISVFLGNNDGTFQAMQPYNPGGVADYSIVATDVNGDGKTDLVVTHDCISAQNCPTGGVGVLVGNGDGTFQSAQNYPTNADNPHAVTVADVNGDGKLDLIVGHDCNPLAFCNTSPVTVQLGNGDGTFQKALRYYSGGRDANAITAADVNGDAKPDILVVNGCFSFSDRTSGSVGVLLGTAGVFTTAVVQSTPNPSIYGNAVNMTVKVTSVGPAIPAGTVRLLNGSTGLGTATLNNGIAMLTKTNLPAGQLSITAAYNGDVNSAKSTSNPVIQTVQKARTKTTLASSQSPSAAGQAVTFTATVTSPTTKVTGSVTFTAGSATLGTVPLLAGGKASLTTSALPSGSITIKAIYEGTANIRTSSTSITQTVD